MNLKLESLDEQTALAHLWGEVDVYVVPSLEEALEQAAAEYERLVVDLGEVTYIDSSGLGMLSKLHLAMRDQGKEMRIACNNERILRTFRIAGIPDLRSVSATVPEALDALGQTPLAVEHRERPEGWVELSLPRQPEYVAVARATAAGVCARMDLCLDEADDVKIALSEACTNVVEHAELTTDRMRVRFEMGSEELVIEVHDPNTYVDWKAKERGDGPDGAVGGVGIVIMKELMDDVQFESEPGQGSRVRLIKRLR